MCLLKKVSLPITWLLYWLSPEKGKPIQVSLSGGWTTSWGSRMCVALSLSDPIGSHWRVVVLVVYLFICLSGEASPLPASAFVSIALTTVPQGHSVIPQPPPTASQTADGSRGASHFDMPEQRLTAFPPLGCYDITGCVWDSEVAAPLCSAHTRHHFCRTWTKY